jgi:hypothetical protein
MDFNFTLGYHTLSSFVLRPTNLFIILNRARWLQRQRFQFILVPRPARIPPETPTSPTEVFGGGFRQFFLAVPRY